MRKQYIVLILTLVTTLNLVAGPPLAGYRPVATANYLPYTAPVKPETPKPIEYAALDDFRIVDGVVYNIKKSNKWHYMTPRAHVLMNGMVYNPYFYKVVEDVDANTKRIIEYELVKDGVVCNVEKIGINRTKVQLEDNYQRLVKRTLIVKHLPDSEGSLRTLEVSLVLNVAENVYDCGLPINSETIQLILNPRLRQSFQKYLINK